MQQAAEVDLDRLVDYKTEYCSVIKKHKITGDNLTGLCPFHDDRANSFSVDLKTGMWHCFAEDEGGNFVTFYAKLNGLDTKEAYKQILEKYGALNEPQEKPKEKKPGLDHYTVSQYSFEKRLPEDWLKEQCSCRRRKTETESSIYTYHTLTQKKIWHCTVRDTAESSSGGNMERQTGCVCMDYGR